MPDFKPVSQAIALLVASSLIATPALAAELPSIPSAAPQEYSSHDATPDLSVNNHRWYRYRRNRVDAGDVLAGVLIIGGIAAIANAASKNNRNQRYRDRDYRYPDRDYRDRDRRYRDRDARRYDDSRGIDRAVDMCVRAIERDVRVDTVDSIERDGSGWEVEGRLYNGEKFSCEIGSDGRIEDIDYAGGRDFAAAAPVEDNQWSDDRYAQARARLERRPSAPQAQPSYPGGPLPGEEIDGDLAQSGSGGDDRYSAHESPDFSEA